MKTYTKDQIIKPSEMPEELLRAYLKKAKEFGIEIDEGVRYNGCRYNRYFKKVHYFTLMNKQYPGTFCVTEEKK